MRLVLYFTILCVTALSFDAAAQESRRPACSPATVVLPVMADNVLHGAINLDVILKDKIRGTSPEAKSAAPLIAACNGFVKTSATRSEYGVVWAYGTSRAGIALLERRFGVLFSTGFTRAAEGNAVVTLKLPAGHGFVLMYSVCDRDTREWNLYGSTWQGQPRLQLDAFHESQQEAYGPEGKCRQFKGLWGALVPHGPFFRS